MSQAGIILFMVSLVGICFGDYLLSAAAVSLILLTAVLGKGVLVSLGKPVFSLGIFFLMVFILLPIASEKVRFSDLTAHLRNPLFYVTMATAVIISYLGGRGVGFLQQPYILFATILGTLLGVLFLKGLPAGLIIAAGVISVMARFI